MLYDSLKNFFTSQICIESYLSKGLRSSPYYSRSIDLISPHEYINDSDDIVRWWTIFLSLISAGAYTWTDILCFSSWVVWIKNYTLWLSWSAFEFTFRFFIFLKIFEITKVDIITFRRWYILYHMTYYQFDIWIRNFCKSYNFSKSYSWIFLKVHRWNNIFTRVISI